MLFPPSEVVKQRPEPLWPFLQSWSHAGAPGEGLSPQGTEQPPPWPQCPPRGTFGLCILPRESPKGFQLPRFQSVGIRHPQGHCLPLSLPLHPRSGKRILFSIALASAPHGLMLAVIPRLTSLQSCCFYGKQAQQMEPAHGSGARARWSRSLPTCSLLQPRQLGFFLVSRPQREKVQ